MFRLLRRLAIGLGLMLMGAGVALFLLYRAATAPVPEYQALVERTQAQYESGELDQNRQELESQLAAVYSEAAGEEAGRWQTLLTAEQLNGWLATQLEQEYPELAEQGLLDPRVLLKPDVVTFALRAEMHGVNAVVAIDLQPYATREGSLAIELAEARVGSATLPAAQILNQLEKSMGEQDNPLAGGQLFKWTQNNGNPVLLVDLQSLLATADYLRSLETVEIREGEIFVAGATTPRTPQTPHVADAGQSDTGQADAAK